MTEEWVEAGTALEIGGNQTAIWERSYAGLIRARAEVYRHDGKERHYHELPRDFWLAVGRDMSSQNWKAGDFSAGDENGEPWQAFGTRFDLEGLLALVPSEHRAAVRLRHSVAGNPAWVSARDAIQLASQAAQCCPERASEAVIEQCRLKFISARAVEMRFVHEEADGIHLDEREWDVPPWCWENFSSNACTVDQLKLGRFAGDVRAPAGFGSITLSGLHFLRTSLDVLSVKPDVADSVSKDRGPAKPNLPEAKLSKWWGKLVKARDRLTQEQLLVLARAKFPGHTVTRERMRQLTQGRTRGPKPVTR